MRFATYRFGGVRRVGVGLDGRLVDLGSAYRILFGAEPPGFLLDLKALVEAGWRGLRLAELVVGEVLKEVDSGGPSLPETSAPYHRPRLWGGGCPSYFGGRPARHRSHDQKE